MTGDGMEVFRAGTAHMVARFSDNGGNHVNVELLSHYEDTGSFSIPQIQHFRVDLAQTRRPVYGQPIDALVAEIEQRGDGDKLRAARRRLAERAARHNAKPTLRQLRLERGLSQADLAKMCNTHQTHIARIENGDQPRAPMLRRLKNALNVDFETLMACLDV